MDSDSQEFGGFGRLNSSTEFHTLGDGYAGRENSLMVYIPARAAFILARKVWLVFLKIDLLNPLDIFLTFLRVMVINKIKSIYSTLKTRWFNSFVVKY